MKYRTINEIIEKCVIDIEKDIEGLKFVADIDFIDIFPMSQEHRTQLDAEALRIASVVDKTERGNFYVFKTPVLTKFGLLKIFKVRKFDETRLKWVAAPDFQTTNFDKFYETYSKDRRFNTIQKPEYKGLEFKTKKSLIYFLDELTTDYYNV